MTETEKQRIRDWANLLHETMAAARPGAAVTHKFMFGGAGFFVDGVMFAGYFGGETFALKLPPDARDDLFAQGGTPISTPDMWIPLYAEVPPHMADDVGALIPFVETSAEFAIRTATKKKRKS